MKYNPHDYQKIAMDHLRKNPKAALFLDCGLGKTSATLTVLEERIGGIEVLKTLIIAPKLVTEQTWSEEIQKWDHTRYLSYSKVIGTEKQRVKALNTQADIYIISRDNIAWLVHHLLKQSKRTWPFDCLILDELSSFKNASSQRFKALKKISPLCRYVIGLTGTPAPNSLLELWPQLFLLDQGVRLGRTLTSFRDIYATANYNGFGYTLREGADKIIQEKVKDICISMRAVNDPDNPKREDIVKYVELKEQEKYTDFKKNEVLELLNGEDITPLSAGALYNKLLQFCNGAVYDMNKDYHIVDDTKLQMVVEAYEELKGSPVIIFYAFKSDLERIKRAIPEAQTVDSAEDLNRWNKGEIKCLVAHPASMGHGLNLQSGGHYMFWFGLPWSLELYLQAVARLDRQGQKYKVLNFLFVAKGTIEELVLSRLLDRAETQNNFMEALKKHLFSR